MARWKTQLENDLLIPKSIIEVPLLREVCYAGYWLAEQLHELKCPEDLIVRIQHAAGGLSFGRDIWETHQMVLNSFRNDEIQIEPEPFDMN